MEGAPRLSALSPSASQRPAALSAGAGAGGACCILPRGPKPLNSLKPHRVRCKHMCFALAHLQSFLQGAAFVRALQTPKLSEMGTASADTPGPRLPCGPPTQRHGACASLVTSRPQRQPPRLPEQRQVKEAADAVNHLGLPLRPTPWLESLRGRGLEPAAGGGAPGSGGLQRSEGC